MIGKDRGRSARGRAPAGRGRAPASGRAKGIRGARSEARAPRKGNGRALIGASRGKPSKGRMGSFALKKGKKKPKDPLDAVEKVEYVAFNVDGEKVRIPVGDDGYVPEWAIAQRFQEVGDYYSDVGKEDDKVLPNRLTPEEILPWWLDPSSCDIRGIDDGEASAFDTSSLPPELQYSQKRIAILAEPKEQARLRGILAESFDPDELETMQRWNSIVVFTMPNCGQATGCYWRKQGDVEVPLIVLEEGVTPDSVVHEFVHHLRAIDPSRHGTELGTAFPSYIDGTMDEAAMARLPKAQQDDIVRREESYTVAETDVRTRPDRMQSGYYDTLDGMDPRQAYMEDKRLLAGVPPDTPAPEIPTLRGKAARDAVTKGYAYSNIARAHILSQNVRKRRCTEQDGAAPSATGR